MILIRISFTLLLALIVQSCNQETQAPNSKQLATATFDACNSPDADISCCFNNMPASLTNTMKIADEKEEGERLVISGRIFQADGTTPNANVILYAYHTDAKGMYSKSGTEEGVQKWHGHLHGWCKTDSEGRYEIHSIRPARYPDNTIPAHIHAAVKTENGYMTWINDFVFKDDDLITEKYISSLHDNGGTGVMNVKRNAENIWECVRDIIIKK